MSGITNVRIKQKAVEVYASFTQQERRVVQFGMLPMQKTETAQAELIAEFQAADGRKTDSRDISRLLAVAIMDAANAGPDKMVC